MRVIILGVSDCNAFLIHNTVCIKKTGVFRVTLGIKRSINERSKYHRRAVWWLNGKYLWGSHHKEIERHCGAVKNNFSPTRMQREWQI